MSWKHKYDYVSAPQEGRHSVLLGGKFGHVDLDGNVTTPIIYDGVWDFLGERARVGLNGKFGHVDLSGNVTTPIIFDRVELFFARKTEVEINGSIGTIDKNGNILKGHHDLIKGVFK